MFFHEVNNLGLTNFSFQYFKGDATLTSSLLLNLIFFLRNEALLNTLRAFFLEGVLNRKYQG